MKPSFCLIAALMALGLACEREPDEPLFIVGRLVDEDGGPLAGVSVRLERNASPWCYGTIHPSTGGIDAGTYEAAGEFSSNERGDFLFELIARESWSDLSYGNSRPPACFRVTAATSVARSEILFSHPGGDVELADLPLVSSGASVDASPDGIVLRRPPIPNLPEYDALSSGWTLQRADGVVWVTAEEDEDGGVTVVQPELCEDFSVAGAEHLTVGTYARAQPPLSTDRPLYTVLRVGSLLQPVDLPDGEVPISRGAACEPALFDGGTCPLTDGSLLAASWEFSGVVGSTDGGVIQPPPPPPVELSFDLGEARPVSSLIARGLRFTLPVESLFVEGSTDGDTWEEIGSFGAFPLPEAEAEYQRMVAREVRAQGLYRRVTLIAPEPIRYVRIRGKGGLTSYELPDTPPEPVRFLGASEISIY